METPRDDTMIKPILILLIAGLCSACDLSNDLNVKNIKGYEFSLLDIQEFCTVKRDGDQHLAIHCAKDKLRPVMRSCEGQMAAGLKDPKFYCGGGLWELSKVCYVEMLDTHKGNIKCKKK